MYANKNTITSIILESSYTGHRSEHVGHLMRYINSQPSLSGKYLFLLNEQMKTLLGDLVLSDNYTILFLDFNQKHANVIKRSFWEWKLISPLLASYSKLDEIIFLDIDPYLVLIATSGFKKYKLTIKGVLFQPYIHFKQRDKGIKFLVTNCFKTYVYQKLAVVLNHKVQKVFILNDYEAVETLNNQIKNIFNFLPDPIESEIYDIDAPTYNSIIQKYRISQSKKNLLLFGSIDDRKNVVNIVDSLALLPPAVKDNIHFIIAGRFHSSVLEKYTEHIRLRQQDISIVFYNEFVTDFEREVLFESCDLVLMPYINFFSSSGILGHAIKNNKNVVVSDNGLVAKLVKQHGLGIAVDPFNTEQIKEAVLALLAPGGRMVYNSENFLNEYSPANYSKKILLN